jgi:hypothetical protein
MRTGAKTTALVLLVFTFLSLGRLFAFEEINKALFTFLIIIYDNLKILYKYMLKSVKVGKERVHSYIIKNDLQEALNELFDIESYWKDMDNYE